MTATTASQAFVDAAAAMVQQDDVAGTLTRLLADCAKFTAAEAIGLLVKHEDGSLEILSATSHQAAELELYQLQQDSGPCVDVAQGGSALSVAVDAELIERWGQVGEAIIAAGYHAVHAVPLRWHGRVIGAMNAFHSVPETADREAQQLTQAFADIAAVVIIQSAELTPGQLDERIRTALAGRTVIEQAKGVLAQLSDVDMAAAYELLVQRAADSGVSLTQAANGVIEDARKRP
jgi:transcriptional regulator with GAF, ATPase, and Fis domain